MTIRLNTAMRNAIADSIASLMGYTTLRIYSGSQPASGDTAATGTLLVEITLQGFNAAASGVPSDDRMSNPTDETDIF